MPHIVLIPFEDRGHLLPLMGLARKLEAMDVIVTFIFPSKQSRALISEQPEGPDLRFAVLDIKEASDHAGGGFVRQQEALERMLQGMVEDPDRDVEPDDLPVVAVVADIMNISWARPVAEKLLLPWYVFYASSAANLALTWAGSKQPAEDLQAAESVLVNTCEALEPKALERIRADHIRRPAQYVHAVGPLLPASYFEVDDKGELLGATKASAMVASSQEKRCKEWLDSQKPSSVVFVSFGSRSFLAEDQLREIALGLEASKHPFLWALPTPPEASSASEYLSSALPEGFEQRTKGQGLLVPGWAPQHLILAHPSLGGFVTHCGWNSVLECVCLAAVPMLCWPLDAEQPVICDFVVNQAKVGLQAAKGDKGLVARDEVERQVRLLFSGPQAGAMRERLAEMRDATRKCLAKDGSSTENLWGFVGDLYT